MKLRDILNSPSAHHIKPRPITISVLGHTEQGAAVKADKIEVAISYVSEKDRSDAMKDAETELRAEYGETVPDPGEREQRCRLHILARALRDADNPRQAFADTPLHLRHALVGKSASDAWLEYCRFVAEEFPDHIDPEDFEKLVKEAEKKPLRDLLTSSESSLIRRAWPSLLAHFGK